MPSPTRVWVKFLWRGVLPAPPIGGFRVYLFSWLQKSFRPLVRPGYDDICRSMKHSFKSGNWVGNKWHCSCWWMTCQTWRRLVTTAGESYRRRSYVETRVSLGNWRRFRPWKNRDQTLVRHRTTKRGSSKPSTVNTFNNTMYLPIIKG